MHEDESPAHQHVAHDGGQDHEGVHAGVHEVEGHNCSVVILPVNEAPGARPLERDVAQSQAWQRAKQDVGDVNGEERQRSKFLVYVLVVEIRVVYGQVSFHWHGKDNAELDQEEEEQDEARVLAQRLAPRPGALHVGGDGDRAGEHGAQQVRHC